MKYFMAALLVLSGCGNSAVPPPKCTGKLAAAQQKVAGINVGDSFAASSAQLGTYFIHNAPENGIDRYAYITPPNDNPNGNLICVLTEVLTSGDTIRAINLTPTEL
jgi:hypothetical protein